MLRSPFHVKRRTQSQYLSEADGRVDICYHRAEESAWYFQHQKHLFSAFIFCPLRVTSFGRHTRHFHLEASTSLSSRRKKAFVHSCKQVQNLKVSCCVLLFCRRLQHLSKMTCSDYTVLRGGVGAIHRDHQMLCFSSNLGSATWLVNTARPSTEYISSKWTFIFYSSKSTLNVSRSVNSSGCSHSRSVALDHGEHQLSPSKHQTSKSHMLCSVSSLSHLLLIFKPLCNPAPLQLLSCCIPWPTVHWNDFSVTSSRQTESVRPVLLWTIPSHLPEVFARLNRISGFTTELNFWSFS